MRLLALTLLAACGTSGSVDPDEDDVLDTDTDQVVDTDEQDAVDRPTGEPTEMAGITQAHNYVRRPFDLPDLVWDDDLAAISLAWAQHLADNKNCDLEHDRSSPYGENLYWTSGSSGPRDPVISWASEVDDYDYDGNSCRPGRMCGHYTQIVWEDTQRVGCAAVTCPGNGGEIWMCNYDPAGNWVGEWPY